MIKMVSADSFGEASGQSEGEERSGEGRRNPQRRGIGRNEEQREPAAQAKHRAGVGGGGGYFIARCRCFTADGRQRFWISLQPVEPLCSECQYSQPKDCTV